MHWGYEGMFCQMLIQPLESLYPRKCHLPGSLHCWSWQMANYWSNSLDVWMKAKVQCMKCPKALKSPLLGVLWEVFCADEDLITLACCLLTACSVSLKHSLPITHASTSSYYTPFIFSQHPIRTWTWLKPDDYHSKQEGLSFNWSLWDQIARSVSNTNGHRMSLTSPSVQRSLWCQPVRINSPHQATVPIYYESHVVIFYRETLRLMRPIVGIGKVIAKSQMFKYQKSCLYVDDIECIGNRC